MHHSAQTCFFVAALGLFYNFKLLFIVILCFVCLQYTCLLRPLNCPSATIQIQVTLSHFDWLILNAVFLQMCSLDSS